MQTNPIPNTEFDLDEGHKCSLTSYLNSAATYFDEIAKESCGNYVALVEQFQQQAAEARRLAARLDSAEYIRIGKETE